jgi:hypothetical protein
MNHKSIPHVSLELSPSDIDVLALVVRHSPALIGSADFNMDAIRDCHMQASACFCNAAAYRPMSVPELDAMIYCLSLACEAISGELSVDKSLISALTTHTLAIHALLDRFQTVYSRLTGQ